MRYPARQEDPWSRRVEVGRIHEQAFRPEVAHMIEGHHEHDRATQEVDRFKAFGLVRDRLRADRRHRFGSGEVRAHNTIPLSPETSTASPQALSRLIPPPWPSPTPAGTRPGAAAAAAGRLCQRPRGRPRARPAPPGGLLVRAARTAPAWAAAANPSASRP